MTTCQASNLWSTSRSLTTASCLVVVSVAAISSAAATLVKASDWASSEALLATLLAIGLCIHFALTFLALTIFDLLKTWVRIEQCCEQAEAGPITPAPCTHPSDPAAAQVMAATVATRSGAGTPAKESEP